MSLIKCKECNETISNKAKVCPQCGAPVPKSRTFWKVLLAVIVLYAIFGPALKESSTNRGTSFVSAPIPKVDKVTLKYRVVTRKFALRVNFEIINNNPFPVKDVEIDCVHYAKSGTKIDSNSRTIYDIIPANSQSNFPKFNMGIVHIQAHETKCEISGLERK